MATVKRQEVLTACVLVSLICISAVVFAHVASGSFTYCAPQQPTDSKVKAIAALDGIADVGLKLSTTLVGFATALLLVRKEGVKLSFTLKMMLLLATSLFVQSALYAVWWRLGVAELWLNNCLDLIDQPRLGRRYQAHFYFFLGGLAALGGLVTGAIFSDRESEIEK